MAASAVSALERLIVVRPDSEDLWPYKRQLDHGLELCLDSELDVERTTFWLGPELSRSDDEIRCIANWENTYNDGTVLLSIRVGALRAGDKPEGTCELGPILSQVEYVYGADLLAVRDAGLRLSWAAACWLHGAARENLLVVHHANGKVHGNLRRIRFGVFQGEEDPRPFDEVPVPFHFLNARNESGTDEQRARELSVLARAIAELTTHPDPAIDRLLRSDSDELRDLLLERGDPVDQLLLDRVNAKLALAPLPDDEIDVELAALWRTVIALDPMIDPRIPSAWAHKPEPTATEPLTATEAELIRQIVDRPDDIDLRLVLADLLMERDDARGELIRIRHELDTLPIDDQTEGRVTREQELVARHGLRLAGEIMEHAVGFELAGGFVDVVTMSAGAFRDHGARLFATQPIRKLRLKPCDDGAIASLARAPELRTLRALELGGRRGYMNPLKLSGLRGAPLDRLEELELQMCRIDDHDEEVLANLAVPALRALWLHGVYMSGRALRGLFANHNLDALETLWCSLVGDFVSSSAGTDVSDELGELADQAFGGRRMRRLRRISLTSCWFANDARVASLVRGAPELATFELNNETGPETLDAVAGCQALERLILICGLEPDLLERVVALPRLSVLQLQAQSAEQGAQVTQRLLALPATHPLRHARLLGYQPIADLQARFPWSDSVAP